MFRIYSIALILIAVAARGQELPNASFEQAAGTRPAGWKSHTWQGEGTFAHGTITHTGKRSARISSSKGGDLSWYVEVPVRPFARYRLSGWIRTESLRTSTGRGALLNVHGLAGAETQALSGTQDWTRVEVTFESGARETLWINCLFGGWGLASGTAWYDDLKLELLAAIELAPAITLDAGRTGAPISKYIYGQFIEHLGRCIYGGIWAEMLADRKFYYALGDPHSPWRAIGGPQAVRMVKEDSYTGEHTPQVRLAGVPSGIAQGGLGLVAGKEYRGAVVLAGSAEAGPVEVTLRAAPGEGQGEICVIARVSPRYARFPLRFKAGADSDEAVLEIVARGRGWLRVGAVSLMPADNVQGLRADTLALLKQLDAPIYRWPGGNFVSGYDWRDGTGERDRRPPRKNPAWKGIESNDFGIDEFLTFCRLLDSEPLVVVNTGQGDVPMALAELRHAAPQGVHWWGLGNEMYGGWQLGHVPIEQYVERHNAFAAAMRAADPSIALIAVGAAGPWSEQMLRRCAEQMDLISEHFYCQSRPGLLAHIAQIPAAVEAKVRAHRAYREKIPALRGKNIRIALDEWNYWYGPHLYGELGTRYFLRDALGIAAGLNAMIRNSDLVFMANYAQTVNVIGCIKTSKTAAAFATTALPLMLYRHHFGALPIAVGGDPRPLDVAAAWSADRRALTLAIVNPMRTPQKLAITLRGVKLGTHHRRWIISGPGEMAYNEPGKAPQVAIAESAFEGDAGELRLEPISISLYRFEVEAGDER